MKKIGEYTARGIVSEDDTTDGNPQKISLFDGRFDTAYRITDFKIWGSDWSADNNPDAIGKLSKNAIGSGGTTAFMRADDDNQIAWAVTGGSVESGHVVFNDSIVDHDNLVVEDLYVYVRNRGGSSLPINYLVTMEKYEISDWQGALAMARDRADGE